MRIIRITALTLLVIIGILLTACSQDEAVFNWQDADWNEIVSAAENTEVSFYMWGGDTAINQWIDAYVADKLLSRYSIRLKRVPMDAPVFVNRLMAEKEAMRRRGSIDLMWINGENFKRARQADVLSGPFLEKLPNYHDYVAPETAAYDFGFPTDGYEAPWGRAQFVFEYDSAAESGHPESFAELPDWVRNNPGRFTYPEPSDFTGSAFIRQAFLALNRESGRTERFYEGWDESLYRESSEILWDYLNDLAPYLWQEGRSYPRELSVMDSLFERGEIAVNMNYTQANAQSRILEGRYPDTVRTFVMDEGTVFGTHFTAIAWNSTNPAGALVLANLLLDPEVQASKNEPANWGDFTVLEISRLSAEDQERFASIDLGSATLPLDQLDGAAVPDISSEYIEALQDDWYRYVLDK
ncbi:ABC transporter substrate-binding protein [Spirochaeta dissipatitropha]